MLAALIPTSEARAQESIPVGARVRVTAPDIAEKPIDGTVSSLDTASITLAVPGEALSSEQTIPLTSVSRLEIYRGRSHSPLKGMGTGLLVGAGAGLAIGIGAATEDSDFVCEGAGCIAIGTLGGAFWGVVIGGLFGAAIGHDEWDEVMVLRPGVSVQPAGGGFALALSLRF
jgi:hypothetical protein